MKYLDIIEKSLGIELTEKEVAKTTLDPLKLRDLAFALKQYYLELELPEKNTDSFRPYVPIRFTDGSNASMIYNSTASGGGQLFENYFETAAKSYLLYAHEICLHDPLSYMLDYFQLNMITEHALNRLPAIKQVLTELARLKPLIERNIIHIISDQMFPGVSDYALVSGLKEISEQVAQKLGDDFFFISFEQLVKSVYEQQKLNSDIDLYFPTEHYARLYRTILEVCGDKFISSDIKPAYEISLVGGLQLLTANQLSVKDIIGMREDENVFSDWRLLISATLTEIENNKAYYNDHQAEFKKVIHEQNRKLQLDALKNADKSAFITNLPKLKEKVYFGLTSYGLLNSTMPDGFAPGPGSLNNTFVVAILEQLGAFAWDELAKARIRKAKKNHFLLLK